MKRFFALLLCMALILSGCGWREPDYLPSDDALLGEGETAAPTVPQAVQALSLPYDPNGTMNPYLSTDYTNRVLFSLIYQGLFTVNRSYEASPILCKAYQVSPDMRTWTFELASATFSDGTAVTPADVVASLQASKSSPWYGNRLQHVKSITATPTGLVLTLDAPCDSLPLLLDIPIVKASETAAAQPLGTGPYRLDGASLRRQAGWWCKANLPVSAQTIPLIAADSAVQVRDSFEMGEISLVCTDPGSLDYVDYRCDYELWDCESGQFVYMICGRKSTVLLENDAVRTALTHAIDRESLVQYYRGFARSAYLPASPQFPYYDSKLAESYGYDPQKLKDAVASAGLESTSLVLMVSSADIIRRQVAQEIAATLSECGLKTTLKLVAPEDLADELRWGTYDLFLGQTRLSANMDLSAFFSENGKMNYGGLADASTYALCLEALANGGNYYSLHKKVMENARLIPILFHSYAIYGLRGATVSLQPARDNLFYYDLGLRLSEIETSA